MLGQPGVRAVVVALGLNDIGWPDSPFAPDEPAHPARLLPVFDSGDHLHPGDAGYRAMADTLDLAALIGRSP